MGLDQLQKETSHASADNQATIHCLYVEIQYKFVISCSHVMLGVLVDWSVTYVGRRTDEGLEMFTDMCLWLLH
jgi:hypothetical protein